MESQLSISWCVMKFVDPHEDEGRRCHTMRLVARNLMKLAEEKSVVRKFVPSVQL